MFSREHDPDMAMRGRENLEHVLAALEELKGPFTAQKAVSIRLGHVTAITLNQAYRLRCLPFDVKLELNGYSNIATLATPDQGSLPILKLLVADALYTKNVEAVGCLPRSLGFGCSTDGGGVQHSNLRKEFGLALMLIKSYKLGIPLPKGGSFDGSLPSIKVYPDDLKLLEGSVSPEALQRLDTVHKNSNPFSAQHRRNLRFVDLLPDVQQLVKADVRLLEEAFPRYKGSIDTGV